MPCEQEEARAEVGGADGAQDLEPGFVEVGAAAVGDEGEAAARGVRGKHRADELVVGEAARGCAREVVGVKGEVEVEVASDERGAGLAEAGFGELAFNDQVADDEVELGAIREGAGDREIGANAELWSEAGREAEQLKDGRAAEDAGVAEDVHQQGV